MCSRPVPRPMARRVPAPDPLRRNERPVGGHHRRTSMLTRSVVRSSLVLMVAACASSAAAQMPNPYGQSINLESARKTAAPALAEARKNGWNMAVAIVDVAGDLVYFEKMDATQTGSVDVAIGKARSAARFKRPTKTFQEGLAAGG